MRGNPLPEPPKDVWNSSPYRQVLANLPNDVGRLFNFENLQQQTVLDQPERSSSRLGGLFGSRRDKEKKSLKGLFRSFSTSAHGHQGSSSRHGHHHSQPQVTSFVIPPILGDPPPGADAAPRSPVIPIPQPGPPVRFNHTGDYSGFVNHSHHRVLYRNKTYPTALHLLEAMKFTERPDLAERIRTCADVNDMYPLSASFQQFVRSDWGQVFLKTMDEVLHLKFKQHPVLRALLLRTGLSDIIYADANSYWGEGPQGEGANELGKALARVRDRLRREGER
ncbi:hypothetical protein F5I97DRAFT_1806076 [Phlebopus sp. FC_14]|nr:hypothetical protein F5I97DRAFT_1806076 [Phlebopus sp. FC_14]